MLANLPRTYLSGARSVSASSHLIIVFARNLHNSNKVIRKRTLPELSNDFVATVHSITKRISAYIFHVTLYYIIYYMNSDTVATFD